MPTRRIFELVIITGVLLFPARGGVQMYLPGEIDFLAAYIIPEDTWYIVPLEAFLGSTSLLFRRRADPKPGLYDQYNEAWHLLRPK